MCKRSQLLILAICFLSLGESTSPTWGNEEISFSRDIRPILSDHCFACHGPDEGTREAELRLDDGSALEHGIVTAGDVDNSELWRRITSTDPDEVMPPPEFKKDLDDEQRSKIKRWIESGAEFERHWAFIEPQRPQVPDVSGNQVRNEVDAFIQAKLRDVELSPEPEADRNTLIRRVTLDLTGLPPTPAEVKAFINDKRPDAYERLIDELMTRVSYGQQMARPWLDLARYADTHGLHLDNERTMWPYRDWVVRAFHDNLPFDDFTRWQLAGDLLDSPTRDQLIASGFNRCNVTTSEGGSINEEWVFRYAVDRTTTAAEVWMGLTAGCAVCHDHKFDPISARDYYSMYAFFHSAADPAMDGNRKDTPPILKLPTEAEEQRAKALREKVTTTKAKFETAINSYTYADPAKQEPVPTATEVESIWFEDGFPAGANQKSDGPALRLVTAETGAVFSGTKALQRTSPGLSQDFYQEGAKPFTIGANGRFFVYCYLDSQDPAQTIMVQFHSQAWRHRVVWGDAEKIPYGKLGTAEKRHLGSLPQTNQWVRLEFTADEIGLNSGDKVTGFAFTQFGGTVTWDKLGIVSTSDPTNDPKLSFQAWTKAQAGQELKTLPQPLRKWVHKIDPETWNDKQRTQLLHHWLANVYAKLPSEIADLQRQSESLAAEIKSIDDNAAYTFVMADLEKPRESFVMIRGAYDQRGERVYRNVPGFLPSLPEKPANGDYSRLDFANWLVSGSHPLTARVTVNRFWQQLFGTGLVRTSADFGSQGDPPSHPELLDWLATQFVKDNWDVNQFMKRLLMSHTYRQNSYVDPAKLERDPSNRLLARGPRLRLDAEVLRDQALYVSGLLVDKVGGKGVNPYQPPNIWEPVGFGNSNTRYYKQGTGDDLYRRSIYTFLKRTAPPPFMATFDAPNRELSCTRRERTNTPMQALQLMNDVQHFEAARAFAERIIKQGGDDDASRIRWAWMVVTARAPETSEVEVAKKMLNDFRVRYASDSKAAEQVVSYGESAYDQSLDTTELASYSLLANLLLNLDETVNKN